MQINIPEGINDGTLKVLPAGIAVATLEKIMFGKSKSNMPKLTFRYTITEEMADNPSGVPTTGEVVLETYSLQPQALFKLAGTYKEVTGETLPQGDYDEAAFTAMMQEALCGSSWKLFLENQIPADGSSTEERTVITKKSLA